MPDSLTALRTTNGKPATKKHTWTGEQWETESYSAGSHFEWATTDIDGIKSLSDALRAVESKPAWFVIRGRPARQAKYLRRTYHPKEKREPAFEPVDRRWMCIDIDGLPAPEADLHPVDAAIEHLPDYFEGVATHWQLSASAGIKDDDCINLHLWYWLDRPVCGFSLREWAKQIPHVDAMLYNPVQPHFTATPIIEGAPDPVEQRSGLREGWAELSLPDDVLDLATWQDQQQKREETIEARRREASRKSRVDPRVPEIRRRYVLSALNDACRKIETAPAGDRHRTIFSQAAAVGELLHTGYLEESKARSQLESAAASALSGEGRQQEIPRTIADGLEHGREKPRDLTHVGVDLDYDDDEPDDGWMNSHQPITCDNFERTSNGCAHYCEWGGCALAEEFLCIEWMKRNSPHERVHDPEPPRSHWSNDGE